MFNRGVVHIVVVGDIVDNYYFSFVISVVHIAMAGDIVNHYCLNLK
jgi:hypothetical protein